ncbi:MAG: TAXI family TRAP transporter solute-binding subunit, partial [Acetobacteraceae bacterium]
MKARRFASILLGAVLALALGTPAMAQRYTRSHGSATAPTAAPAATSALGEAAANAGTVGVISGGVDGTYVRIAADLASVLDDGNHLRVLPVIGKGSVQNVADILYLHGIDIGIVQSDALAYIERHNLYPGVQQLVDYIAKLYEEEVHVLARKDITQLSDLAHQKVNVDVRGSGTAMTASVLFDSLGIPVEATNDDQDAALEKLRRGDIAAIVYVVGKPARLFTPLPADSGLHFLAIPLKDALLDTYLPAQLRHADYPALVPDGKPVDTVAVGAVMAVYNWQPNT